MFTVPYPDESCYSILCRSRVHAAMSTYRFCLELFGRQRNLYCFHWRPFTPDELCRWFENPESRIASLVQKHSCMPYRFPFVQERCQQDMVSWNCGVKLSGGAYKRLARGLGYSSWTKEHLYYCPMCVEDDRTTYGETYWHIIPQLPGVVVCPIHKIPLKNSNLPLSCTGYDLCPAEHWIQDKDSTKPEMSEGEIQFALASRWLMENGWGFTVNRFKMKEQLEQLTEKTLTNLVEETVSFHPHRSAIFTETTFYILLADVVGMSISDLLYEINVSAEA